MKGYMILGMLAVCLLFSSHTGAHDRMINGVTPSPKGLEYYYPPKSDGPVYLWKMLALEGIYSGIAAELTVDDLKGARDLFKVFETEYKLMKNMVTEWQKDFPESEVDALGRALEGTDKISMLFSLGEVGRVCHRCHLASMVRVQQQYRWGNFSELEVEDINGEGQKPYTTFKKVIAVNMAGIRADGAQGQWDSARKHYSALKRRLSLLTDTCAACHAEQPKSYVDQDSLFLLERELGRDQPDTVQVNNLLQRFGGQSCSGCHLIHVPAAMATANSGKPEASLMEVVP